jgi:hypothetical protein
MPLSVAGNAKCDDDVVSGDEWQKVVGKRVKIMWGGRYILTVKSFLVIERVNVCRGVERVTIKFRQSELN